MRSLGKIIIPKNQSSIMVEASLDVAAYEQLNLDGHDQEEIHQNLICSGLEQNSASSESN